MNIGIISDSHGDYDAFCKVLRLAPKCQAWLHAGDVLSRGAWHRSNKDQQFFTVLQNMPALSVALGNNDSVGEITALNHRETTSYGFVVEILGERIWLTHGHGQTDYAIFAAAENHGCKYVVRGHTHRRVLLRHHLGIWSINPGSIAQPREGQPSFAVLDTSKPSISFFDLTKEAITSFTILD